MTQTMREKLIEAAFRAFRDQDKLGRDWFDLGAADDGKTILDGAYDLGIVIDAILAELREPDAAMQEEAFEACDGFVHRIDIPKSWQAMIDHIRSQR